MKITVEAVAPPANLTPPTTTTTNASKIPSVHPRRKTKKSLGGVRLRRESGVPSSRSGSRPETPFLVWKTEEGIPKNDDYLEEKAPGESGRKSKATVSTRKLAAGLWRKRPLDVQSWGSHCGTNTRCNGGSRVECSPVNSPHSVSGPKQELFYNCENSVMEGATKWDPHGWNLKVPKGTKPVDHHQSPAVVVSALGAELDQAKARINELETKSRSSKKKLEQFLQNLSDEKAAWRSKEHNKARAVIEDIKADLTREKKNRQRLEMINSELLNELADLKSSAKQYLQQYEKERKARELVEEVCDELAREIGEDKAEVEALKQESMNAHEEVEEERKMLQMAEVWREERVQMKLVDAKVMLEEKYSEMNRLIAELESFLRSTSQIVDSEEIKKAQFLRQVAASVKMEDIRDLNYEPPNPDEIFSVFEDVKNGGSHDRQGEEPSIGYSPDSHYSKIHGVSPEVKRLNRDGAQRKSNGYIDQNGVIEDDTSEWETVSQDQGSTYSPIGSDPLVRKDIRFCNASRSRAEWEKNGGEETPIMEITEIDPVKLRGSKKGSCMSKLWNSCPVNGEGDNNYKIISVEGRVSNGSLPNGAILAAENGSTKDCFSQNDVTGQWSSPDPRNPHINRAKGCTEWPRSVQKSCLKTKLMEARMESQKVQLRQVLKLKL